MSFLAVLSLAIALSIDAMTVALANTLAGLARQKRLALPFIFGGFQGIMPAIGYLGALAASHWLDATLLEKMAGLVFIVLGFFMIKEGFGGEEEKNFCHITWIALFAQGLATSIDALAAGAYMQTMQAPLYYTLFIALTTCVLVFITLVLAQKVRHHLSPWGGILGGLILCILGIRAIIF